MITEIGPTDIDLFDTATADNDMPDTKTDMAPEGMK